MGLAVLAILMSASFFMYAALSLRGGQQADEAIFAEQIASSSVTPPRNDKMHISLPPEVRGIYWTAVTAGSSRGDELLVYMQETGLNTVVIDLKMDDGELAFAPRDTSLSVYAQTKPSIEDLEALLQKLADASIYRIARIAIMRDGAFAQTYPDMVLHRASGGFWRDKTGSVWVDPAAPSVSDYAIALAHEAYARGFDEVQFDYVRFASDGEVSAIVYPVYRSSQSKIEVMQNFFKTVGSAMQQVHIPVSFDVFGMTFWSRHDYNIGQRLVDVLPYGDFISPMVYPSHYPNGFNGFENPAESPYEIVKQSLDRGTSQMLPIWSADASSLQKKWRPWLQDFDIGAFYTAEKIEAQIKAARDAGASGWILWNARNVYEPANYTK